MKSNNRRCIATHKELPREALIRIVKTKDNKFFVDSKEQGRGCYVSKDVSPEVIIKNKLLNRAFKTPVPNEVYEALILILKGQNNG